MLSTLFCHRPMPLWFQQPIRPLPIMKARMARPNGHHQIKLRIINAIQAGFPNSSILAAIGMAGASRMNVNNIYIASSRCQEGASERDDCIISKPSCPQMTASWRQHLWLQVFQDRASRPALRLPAVLRVISAAYTVPRRRGRTARQCRVTSTRCEERPSRLGGETAAALAHTGSQMRHAGQQMPGPRLHAIRHYRAEFRLQTLLSNRTVRSVQIRDKPCPADRAQ